ncbi:hypothetical protein EZV62_003694 [Acer yangbiense]|uniref:Mediator of RNA polymerase II transcription subunit 6 n=1 Tax=Acer yangbiense TaxID=1000413 RepID=A0A5C7II55_9ROSI|nr:hypothetical protein EZV62_003694 [Acer yangbiense]
MQPGCPGEAVIENVHTLMCIRQLYIIDRGVLQASDLSPEFQNRYHQQKLSDYEMISRIPKFRKMTGIEYVLSEVMEPHLFVIRKQKRDSLDKVTPIMSYYLLDGSIYQAPLLCNIFAARIASFSSLLSLVIILIVTGMSPLLYTESFYYRHLKVGEDWIWYQCALTSLPFYINGSNCLLFVITVMKRKSSVQAHVIILVELDLIEQASASRRRDNYSVMQSMGIDAENEGATLESKVTEETIDFKEGKRVDHILPSLQHKLPPAPPPPPFPKGYTPTMTGEAETGPETQQTGEPQAPPVDPIIDQGPAKRMKF